jgi:thioredoxin-related protein
MKPACSLSSAVWLVTSRIQAMLAAVLLACASPVWPGGMQSFDDSAIVHAREPAWFKKSFLDLREDLAEARQSGKKGLMVYFSTEGCAYCKAFVETSLADEKIASSVRRHFDTVHLDIFDDAEMTDLQGTPMPVKAFAKRERAEFSPTVIFYAEDGRQVFRLVGYQPPERFQKALNYVIEGRYQRESFKAYLASQPSQGSSNKASKLIPDPLFMQPPHILDRRIPAKRPLLVIFEQADCEACGQFHGQVLADPEVRSLLEKFDVAQLNAADESTPVLLPHGQKTTPLQWSALLGLAHAPALVFFDEKGREVLRIDAVVFKQRMVRSLEYVLEKAYLRDIPYQRFTREKSLGRLNSGK